MKIAFAGNPNSGKTTMFNALTGRNEKVGNWAGVTVDRHEAPVKKQYDPTGELLAVDLPGAYSMSPFTSEESITSTYVRQEAPDVLINIVDATNLSRSLFFTTQLLELGIPMVVALNKSDINVKKQTSIDTALLADMLGCPVFETDSISEDGLKELVAATVAVVGTQQTAPHIHATVDLTDKKAVQRADRQRYAFVNRLVDRTEHRQRLTQTRNAQDQLDAVLMHPVWGLGIFAAVMFLVFQVSQAWLGPWMAEGLVAVIDMGKNWVGTALDAAQVNAFLKALLTEGIIGGVSAVVGFLPLVMVMYFLISMLEDCGYMARATVVLDPIFKPVGLSGKSVIPFIMGTGCAIPGIMAARTIRSERERNAAAMLTPFMPCGAKLPVIALFAGAFFPDAAWVGTLMYFVGIVIIWLCALLIKAITGSKNQNRYFIMELPEYKLPSIKRAFMDMCGRGWDYIVKAGTVILLCNTAVYLMQSFNWQFQEVSEEAVHTSILATLAKPVAVLLIPIGVQAWQMAAAAFTGFIAKENVVGTLAVCYGISNLIDPEALELVEGAGAAVADTFGIGAPAALAYLLFNLFSPPCFAAIGAMNAEIKNKKWLLGGIALQLSVGYSLGFLVYQLGTLLTAGTWGAGFAGGAVAVAVMAAVAVWLCVKRRK